MDTKQPQKAYLCFQSKSFTIKTRRPEPLRPNPIGTKGLGNHVIIHQKQQ